MGETREYDLKLLIPKGTPSFHLNGQLELQHQSNETHYYIPLEDVTLWHDKNDTPKDLKNLGLTRFIMKLDSLTLGLMNYKQIETVHRENIRVHTLEIYLKYGRDIGMDWYFALTEKLQLLS